MEPEIMDPPSWDDYPDPVADQAPVIPPAPDVEPETSAFEITQLTPIDPSDSTAVESLADLIAEKVVTKLNQTGDAVNG